MFTSPTCAERSGPESRGSGSQPGSQEGPGKGLGRPTFIPERGCRKDTVQLSIQLGRNPPNDEQLQDMKTEHSKAQWTTVIVSFIQVRNNATSHSGTS